MGIPSYFSYIIKKHRSIIKKHKNKKEFDFLYLDSNSIIYDIVKKLDYSKYLDNNLFEKTIIKNVIDKIENYILTISPSTLSFIAFDGIPPLAKIQQQRLRRYKGFVREQIIKECLSESQEIWSASINITPGTLFMKKLNRELKQYFSKKQYDFKIKLSLSDEPGEGEHKLFEFIRNNKDIHHNKNILIYGLDADLIVLGLNHIPYCNCMYLIREAPNFIGSIDESMEPNELYLLDLNQLEFGIRECFLNKKNIIHDYVFLMSLLGNDFMPHFPSLNIRSNGIETLISSYKKIINNNEYLFDGKIIYWDLVKKLISDLSLHENEDIKEEYRKKQNKRLKFHKIVDKESLELKLDDIPHQCREEENYINPFEEGWESRYYKILLNLDSTTYNMKKISHNYLSMLEWNMKYYSESCPDWEMVYQYAYPPLLIDLVEFIPTHNIHFISFKEPKIFDSYSLLAYVLPQEYHYLLPEELTKELKNTNWYSNNIKIHWAFCKYFWEAKIDFPKISISDLKNICNKYNNE